MNAAQNTRSPVETRVSWFYQLLLIHQINININYVKNCWLTNFQEYEDGGYLIYNLQN